ncbi:MAG TPA: fatty acid desaturase [Stellaceae bacterium]|jgi:fatty acid desaturase
MTITAADTPATPGIFSETATGRSLIGIVDLNVMGRRSNLRGALQAGVHLICAAAAGTLVWLALPFWYLLIPAMTLYGLTLVAMFAPMHECTHRTAFRSAAANDAVGWVAGLLSFNNATYYRYYHSWHHRYTQDPARDPELMFPRTKNRAAYLREISTIGFWHRRAIDYTRLALGLARLPFLPERARRAVAISVLCQLALYAGALAAIAAGFTAPLYFVFLPSLLAMPFLRLYLIAEHTLCSHDQNFLTNTRTTLTVFPVRLLMWNMPFHAEHHLFPAVPFHRLPALHAAIGDRFAHVDSGYIAVDRATWRSFG